MDIKRLAAFFRKSTLFSQPVNAHPRIREASFRVGVSEVSIPDDFDGISRAIIYQRWAGTNFNWTNFCDGAALTVGIQIIIDGRELFPETIKDNHDWKKYSYDTDIVADTLGPGQSVLLSSRLSFFKMLNGTRTIPGNHERDHATRIRIKVGDDLSGVGTELSMSIQGWISV